MTRTRNALIMLLLTSPFTVLAHGEEVLLTVLLDVIVVFSILICIGFLKWKISGKILLLFTLVVSLFLTFIAVGDLPYQKNATVINILSVAIPLISVLGVYLLLRKNFSKQHE